MSQNRAAGRSNPAETQLSQNTTGDNSTHYGPDEQQEHAPGSRDTSPEPEDNGSSGVAPPARPLNSGSIAVLAACDTVIKKFREQKCSKPAAIRSLQSILSKAIPNDDESLDEVFGRYLIVLENHEKSMARAEKRGHQDPSDKFAGQGAALFEDEGHTDEHEPPTAKKARTDESDFPWAISNFIHSTVLSPSLDRSLKLLQLYAVDPKKAKRSLTNSPTCPEFPDSEWTNVLAGRAVNLDHVLSGYYSVSNNDERTESIGDVEIKFGAVSPTKLVYTAGDWSIAWNRTSRATSAAFPHRASEDYSEYIIGLFGATDILFHDRVIAYDHAVRRRIGSRRDLELTDIHKFSDLKQLHMDSTGAAVIHRSVINAKPASSRKHTEPCNRWNEGLCILDDSACRRLHICNKCLQAGHKSSNCHQPSSTPSIAAGGSKK